MEFIKHYARLPKSEIGFLRFLLEGYDGLAFARTLDAETGLVEIACASDRFGELAVLLDALCDEIGLARVDPPAHVPPL